MGMSIDFRKGLWRYEPWGKSRGSRWRKETGGRIYNITEKKHESSSMSLSCIVLWNSQMSSRVVKILTVLVFVMIEN